MNYTDYLIQEYNEYTEPIRQNYLELNIPSWRLNFLAQHWKYFPGGWQYPGKLSQEDWEYTRDVLVNTGKNVKFDKEADIISHVKDGYRVWLCFYDADGIARKIDVFISEKDSHGVPNGTRRIDSRSPEMTKVWERVLTGQVTPDEARLLVDLASALQDRHGSRTPEAKLQYIMNGSIIEQALLEAAKDCGIKSVVLDTYGQFFYKGSPGNTADFTLFFDMFPVLIDAKLVKNIDESPVREEAHNAQYLICYEFTTKKFITLKTGKECPIDLLKSKEYEEFINRATEIMHEQEKPFIRINSIDVETGKIDYTRF